MPLSIAAWNVNSILARLATAMETLRTIDADIVCLQELKCEDARFPRLEIEELGYNVETLGQKTYNGVAILSRFRIEEVSRGLPGMEDDEQARFLEALVAGPDGPLRVASLYLPNGNPVTSEKYAYKLRFMGALHNHMRARLDDELPYIVAGDYNVIPRDEDCHDPRAWAGDALFQPETRGAYAGLQHLGYSDAYMQADGAPRQYTFWDYQAGAFRKDHGIRIDHLLLSPQAADKLETVTIHRAAREMDKPSDHVPIIARFS